jgi:hypothetical protein
MMDPAALDSTLDCAVKKQLSRTVRLFAYLLSGITGRVLRYCSAFCNR